MLNRTALIVLIIGSLLICGGIVLGGAVENLALEIAENRVSALK